MQGRGDAVVLRMRSIVFYSGVTSGIRVWVLAAAIAGTATSVMASNPWADQVVSYTQGTGVSGGYNDPSRALDSPSRFTPDPTPEFSSVVSPFAPAYLADQVVSVGAGGSLTLRFDEPVANDANNPFGVDLLVFGNSFYAVNFATGITNGAVGGSNASGVIEVSQDGLAWSIVTGVRPDSLFPTLGYSDVADPFSTVPGDVTSDFTRPVNPAFDAAGLNYAGVLAGYEGSGGGVGVSLDSVSLPWINYVRLSLPLGASGTFEVDGVSDVAAIPAPATLLLAPLMFVAHRRRRVE